MRSNLPIRSQKRRTGSNGQRARHLQKGGNHVAFFETGGGHAGRCIADDRSGRRPDGAAFVRHASGRLPDRRSGQIFRRAGQRADRRALLGGSVSLRAARRGKGHDRTGALRRDRSEPRLDGAVQRSHTRDHHPVIALSLSIGRAHAQGHGRCGRRPDRGRLRAGRAGAARLLRRRCPLLLQFQEADQLQGGSGRHEVPRHPVRHLRRHGQRARRQRDPDALRRGLFGDRNRRHRRRREQLSELRHRQARRSREILRARRTYDGAGSLRHGQDELGQADAGGPGGLQAGGQGQRRQAARAVDREGQGIPRQGRGRRLADHDARTSSPSSMRWARSTKSTSRTRSSRPWSRRSGPFNSWKWRRALPRRHFRRAMAIRMEPK